MSAIEKKRTSWYNTFVAWSSFLNAGKEFKWERTSREKKLASGMQPKVLQRLLGHASIKTTMDRYVHVTDESLEDAVRQFEANCV